MGLTFRLGQIPLAILTDTSNNVGIGAAPSGTYKFEVTGTAKVSSTLLLGGALTGTSATFSTEVTSSGSQGRFGGWSTGAGYQGNALEVGVSGGIATLIGYNRTSGAYIPVLIGGNTNQTTTIGGNTIVLQNNGTTALTIASTGAATFSSSVSTGGALNITVPYNAGTMTILTQDNLGNGIYLAPRSNLNFDYGVAGNTNGIINNFGYQNGSAHFRSLGIGNGKGGTIAFFDGTTGNVGIGTSTPTYLLQINSSTTAAHIHLTNSTTGTTSNDGARFMMAGLDIYVANREAGTIIFETSDTERAKITSGGFLKAKGSDSTYFTTNNVHELRTGVGNDYTTIISSTAASPYGVYIAYPNANPNGVVNEFFICADNIATRVVIRSNGGLANYQANNVNLSDERTKKDIIPLESYWNKFKSIEIVKFKYKDQTHDDFNIGVIAQQVESVAPEFIDVDGWDNKPKFDEEGNEIINTEEPLKSVYTSDLHHATIKVLQEAMAKIEELNERLNKAGL